MSRHLLFAALVCVAANASADQTSEAQLLERSVAQLRDSIGRWDVVTEFLNDDATIARTVSGSYEFSWVIPDRVVSGRSEIPELKQISALLFYLNQKQRKIEMVSVAADGQLWIMSGPLGSEQRVSQEYPTTDGGTGQLRFTRFNVGPDAFESRMEYTDDRGATWKPGNHQRFKRAAVAESGERTP